MPDVARTLHSEILRVARKEAKTLAQTFHKDILRERKRIEQLEKRLAVQDREIERITRALKDGGVSRRDPDWPRDRVRETRLRLGMTQKEFAELVGVSQITVSFWETGRTQPRPRQRAAIADARKLSRADAVRRIGRKKTSKKASRKTTKRGGRKQARRG